MRARAAILTGLAVAALGVVAVIVVSAQNRARVADLEERLHDLSVEMTRMEHEREELQTALADTRHAAETAQASTPAPVSVSDSRRVPTPRPTRARQARAQTEELDAELLAQLNELREQLAKARAASGDLGNQARTDALDLVQEGDLHFAEGNLQRARICYLQALERDPDLADPHLRLGMIHEFYGHDKAAVSAYEAYVRLRPESKYSGIKARRMGKLFEETASSAEIYEMEQDVEDQEENTVVIP